jgi:A/G-specific adenine glycosylase
MASSAKLPSLKKLTLFKKKVLSFYKKNHRAFPWRETTNPYFILVSEVMLQQTQTIRVIDFYDRFTTKFPTPASLASASTPTLLKLWKGLGYNRRALALRNAAQEIVTRYNGELPADPEKLLDLPGIGRYTAQAIMAFAFNRPAILVETNIRTVLIHEFFSESKNVTDQDLEVVLQKLQPRKNSREWYYALMDYGVWLKSQGVKTHRQSKHYKKQSPFKGSRRELRGLVLEVLIKDKATTVSQIAKVAKRSKKETETVLVMLVRDGLLIKQGKEYRFSR